MTNEFFTKCKLNSFASVNNAVSAQKHPGDVRLANRCFYVHWMYYILYDLRNLKTDLCRNKFTCNNESFDMHSRDRHEKNKNRVGSDRGGVTLKLIGSYRPVGIFNRIGSIDTKITTILDRIGKTIRSNNFNTIRSSFAAPWCIV